MVRDKIYKANNDKTEIDCFLGLGYGHYVILGNKFKYQNFFMPVITITNKGDIVFNFNDSGIEVSFEFVVDKSKLTSANIALLSDNFNVQIYSEKDCLADFLVVNDINKTLNNIANSNEKSVGISMILDNLSRNDIIDKFFEAHEIINDLEITGHRISPE